MKRKFFYVLAMAMCAFAVISCNKDDNDSNGGGSDAYLTLQEQQDIFSQAINQVAQTLDFSSLQPVIDVVNNLYKEGFAGILVANVTKEMSKDSLFVARINGFNKSLKNETVNFDFSPLYFRLDVTTRDSIKDSLLYLIPEIARWDKTYDCLEINMDVKGNKLTFKGKASDNFITVEATSNELDEKGSPAKPLHRMVTLPKDISLTFLLNQKVCAGLTLNVDTDLKLTANESINDNGGKDKSYVIDASKLNLAAKLNIADISFDIAGKYNGLTGFELTFKTLLDKLELISGNAFVDADMSGLLRDLNENTLAAWAMNYEKLRAIGVKASLMNSKISFDAKLRNPFENAKFITAVTPMLADSVSKADVDKFIDMVSPFITADCYFDGFRNPQSSLELVQNPDLNMKELAAGLSKTLSGFGSYGKTAASLVTVVAGLTDRMGIVPEVRIHAANAADEKLVGVDEFLKKVDFQGAANTIVEKVKTALGALIMLF